MNFGSKIVSWARGCSRWPSFGHFQHRFGPRWLGLSSNPLFFLPGINSFLWILAQKSFPGPGDDPDGQVWAISGPHGVRGGRKWVQNDPDNFLLYPCVMKKCSKVHPLGWGWPCSSPGCISGGHNRPDKFFSFSTPVNLPEHEESGQGHVSVLVNLTFDLVAQCSA